MRPADAHLNPQEFELLLFGVADSNSSNAGSTARAEAQQHLNACAVCRAVAERYRNAEETLKGLEPGNKASLNRGKEPTCGPECPVAQTWLTLAAGLIEGDEARRYIAHAAICDWCGPLLKESMEDMAQDVTPEEQEALAQMPTASMSWQHEMGKKLATQGRRSGNAILTENRKTATRKYQEKALFSWWPRLRWAGASLVLATAVLFGWLMTRELSVNELLAQAYADRRTLELRMEGASYGKLSVIRSSSKTGSIADRPLALVEAEGLIAKKLKQDADNPKWLQLRARADLLEGNVDDAVRSLEILQKQDPDNNSLGIDLATAYFARANEVHEEDYGRAVQVLGEVLQRDPRNPVALFNDAILLEKLSLFSDAIVRWNRYLEVDPSSPWADEARTNLQRVEQKLITRKNRSSAPLLSPGSFSAAIESGDEAVIAALDQRVERYVEAAFQDWIGQAYAQDSSASAIETRRALGHLAVMLKVRHEDEWLSEFMSAGVSTEQQKPIADLIASAKALRGGSYDQSVQFARRAFSDFHRYGNKPGTLWAVFALMYAQTFALRYSECMVVGADGLREVENTRYRWFQVQMLIQRGECQEATGQIHEALVTTSRGLRLAERFRYPGLALRAASFAATYSVYMGDVGGRLHDLTEGLAKFWVADLANTRGENLYTAMSEVAEARNWPHLDALATAELLLDLPVKDPLDRAIQLQTLALAEERAGDYDAATHTLQNVSQALATLSEDPAIAVRKAELAVLNARITLQKGDPSQAASVLSEYRDQYEQTDANQFQAEYFKVYGETLVALGRDAEAEPLLSRALVVIESYLRDLHSEAARFAWSRIQGQLYRDLFTLKLKLNNAQEALAWWESYKSISMRVSPQAGSVGPSSIEQVSAATYVLPQGTTVVSYVMQSGMARAFVLRDGNIKLHSLQLPGDFEPLVLQFLLHCTAPTNDIHILEAESSRLHAILITPLEPDLLGATSIRIETDGILDRIPFGLLQRSGEYLMDRFDLSFSPGLAYRSVPWKPFSPASPALAIAAPGPYGTELPELPEVTNEVSEVVSYLQNAKLLSGSQISRADVLHYLQEARLFHFAGHAFANITGAGLVLGSDSILEAHDMTTLRLPNLRLAVLSACDTANGSDGSFDNVNSLARSLLVAGVSQTIASRWRVNSAATRQLMHAFYANLLSGRTPASSLRTAMAELRKMPGYEHPYYWGAFSIFGNS